MQKAKKKAFTLVEVLLVVVIIAILAAIVIVAINPARQISQANDTQRSTEVKALLDAVHEYAIDHRGVLPTDTTTDPVGEITDTAQVLGSDTTNGQLNLCSELVPTYIAEMPFDPQTGDYTSCTEYSTGYSISQDGDRITVSATGEITTPISVTR